MHTYALLLMSGGVLDQVETHTTFDTADKKAREWVDWQEEGAHDDDAHILLIAATEAGIKVDLIAGY
jgi:hypothetical protein